MKVENIKVKEELGVVELLPEIGFTCVL